MSTVNQTKLLCMSIATAMFLSSSCSQAGTTAKLHPSQIKDAINREICFSYFWYGIDYDLDKITSLTISNYNNSADVWSENLASASDKLLTEFKIKSYRNVVYVESSKLSNLKYIANKSVIPKEANVIGYKTPNNCDPLPTKITKKLFLVEKIIKIQFSAMLDLDKANKRSNVIIANVDDLYPMSLVYVPMTNELFIISITPGSTEENYDPIKYTFGEIYNQHYIKALIPKLRRFGRHRRLS